MGMSIVRPLKKKGAQVTVFLDREGVRLADAPGFLVPYASDLVGPGAAWLFYRGACDYADAKPRRIAAGVASVATACWLALHFYGPPGSTFYASASAEFALVAWSVVMIFGAAHTTMSRLFAAACVLPIGLVALNPVFKSMGISSAVSAQAWLATLGPVALFATCVFLERSMTRKNRALEEQGVQLRRYRHHLEELVEQRTSELEASQRRLHHSERLASIGTLTAGLAHQINNPIDSIMAAAGFAMLSRGDEDEFNTLRKAVVDIEQEAARCWENHSRHAALCQ